MTSAGFEPAIPAIRLLQPYALDWTATGMGCLYVYPYVITPQSLSLLFDKISFYTNRLSGVSRVTRFPPSLPLRLYRLCSDDGGSSLRRNVGIHLPNFAASYHERRWSWRCFLVLRSLLLLQTSGLTTALQAWRLRVPFPVGSLGFFIDIILPAALRPWGRLSL